MTTVADLLIKIGADGSGLSSELGKTKQEIHTSSRGVWIPPRVR